MPALVAGPGGVSGAGTGLVADETQTWTESMSGAAVDRWNDHPSAAEGWDDGSDFRHVAEATAVV